MTTSNKLVFVVLLVSTVVLLVIPLFIWERTVLQEDKTENLIEQLSSSQWSLRKQAAEALGQMGDGRAIGPLVAALEDVDSDVRQKAAEALDKFGWRAKTETEKRLYFIAKKDWDKCVELNGRTAEALISLLSDKNPEIRKKVVEILGQIENPAIKPLVVALRDDNQEVLEKAAEALIRIGGISVIQPFIAALKDERFYTREKAAESLGRIGDNRAVKPLIATLSDTNWKVREKAAEALGRIGDSNAVGLLVAALEDGDSDVRQKAAEALDKFGWRAKNEAEKRLYFIAKKDWDKCVELDGRTVEALISVLSDKNPDIRKEAVETLVKLGGLRTMGPLINALEHHDSNIRKQAAETLGEIGDSRAVKPLIAVLSDENTDVRKAAAGALIKIGGFLTVELLIDELNGRDSKVREEAAEILGKISNPALDPLIAALWDENWEVREEAAKALSNLRDSCAVNPLIAALKYEDSGVGRKTVEGLGIIISPTAGPFTAPIMTRNVHLRIEVIKALGQIGDKRAIPALVLELQCWYTAQAAAGALEKLSWSPQSTEDKVHFLVAKKEGNALRQIWYQTKQVLLKDIESDEDKIVKNALYAFIAVGKEETIKELIDTLNAKGDRTVAEVYHNCGNKKLSSAAQDWEAKHKCYVSTDSAAYLVRWSSW